MLVPLVTALILVACPQAGSDLRVRAEQLARTGRTVDLQGGSLALLVLVAILENCGYRQLNAWWSCVGTVQAMTGKGGWGVMKRRAFDGASSAS